MLIVYISKHSFCKNVDPNGNFIELTLKEYDEENNVIIKDPYLENGMTRIELEDKYFDCVKSDFNEDLTFSIEKYNARKQKEIDQLRIAEIDSRLKKLDQDFRQVDLGAIIPDIAERKAEFITLHNELRYLLGKPPREYNKTLI